MTAQVGDTASNPRAAQAKADLRRLLRQRRAALAPTLRRDHAQRCARHALRALLSRRVRHVAAYLAHRAELSPTPLIERLLAVGVRVSVPRLVRGGMRMIELEARTRLRRNAHGIAEPCGGRARRAGQFDAIVLPLTGFDAQGHRLGSGGGYYDRFLARAHGRGPFKLGYAYACQQTEHIPADPWDVHLDAVCTERGLSRFRSPSAGAAP